MASWGKVGSRKSRVESRESRVASHDFNLRRFVSPAKIVAAGAQQCGEAHGKAPSFRFAQGDIRPSVRPPVRPSARLSPLTSHRLTFPP